MKTTKEEIENFIKKYGKFACREKTDKYLQLTYKNHNLELRYYYETKDNN